MDSDTTSNLKSISYGSEYSGYDSTDTKNWNPAKFDTHQSSLDRNSQTTDRYLDKQGIGRKAIEDMNSRRTNDTLPFVSNALSVSDDSMLTDRAIPKLNG